MNTRLLERLYKTHSPSHQEQRMSALIQKELTRMNIDFEVDDWQQIYRITGEPLLVAHMDQVQRVKCHKVMNVKSRLYGFNKKGQLTGLGADDKNGIFIILELLKIYPTLSFIFSASEEAGGKLHTLTTELDLTSTPYALIFDRRGKSDIVGTSNNYCCDDLEILISVIGEEYGYAPGKGTFSDCDELSAWVPCVNLSCGYYEAHTEKEYTKLPELWNALRLGTALIKELPKAKGSFKLADPIPAYRGSWHWDKDYDYTGYAQPKSKPGKTGKEDVRMIQENALLALDLEEITFFSPAGVGHFIGETVAESLGTWKLPDHGDDELVIYSDRNADLRATWKGIPIDVQEFENGLPGEILTGPSTWATA